MVPGMSNPISRRRALALFGGVGIAAVAGCSSSDEPETKAAAEIPDETAGPFPGDGSNGPDVLGESGVVRSDIRRSFGAASGTADGVPTTVELKLLDVAAGGSPLAGAAVYVWHCTRDGEYSLYEGAAASENFLRGVQESDDDGRLRFTTVFPGAYSGRWPHIHFEVYESLRASASGSAKLKTSQLAIPQDACEAVYATGGYEQSLANLPQTSLDGDMVFSDGYSSQLASWSGSPDDEIALTLNVGV
jgi:protocatechuate 3,4-dioxygenase beta subunit